ncbi:ACP S-malonyltransferase [Bacteriovoracaceae bacterium]|nr:ACP S-malonyltransferase [Bacteriovoracaceae bacterium]
MKKLVLLFPGQGSQYVSMGSNLPQEAINFFSIASEVLDIDLRDLCFNGPQETLNLTKYTQPALLTHSMALAHMLLNEIPEENVSKVIGHSIGEYSALCCAGVFDLKTAVSLVHNRGLFMQEAVPAEKGAMYALLKVPAEKINEIINSVKTKNESFSVQIANYNAEQQIVISGLKEDCEEFIKALEEKMETPYKAVPLKVSAPFHCKLMMPAQEKMQKLLNTTNFNPNKFDYIANIDANVYPINTSTENIKSNLIKQVTGSVLFYPSLNHFDEDCLYVEVGAGKVLSNILRKYNRSFKVVPLDSENFGETIKDIKGLMNE